MAKVAYDYFKVDPWKIIEEEFNPTRNKVAESIFSLGNEYMGVRGYMEEGVSCDSLLGSYFNGIYEMGTDENASHYKGIVNQTHFMVNSVNWLYARVLIDGEKVDVVKSQIKNFKRVLDFKQGDLTRSFVFVTASGKEVSLTFKRFVSMTTPNYGYQRMIIEALNDKVQVEINLAHDFSIVHWGKKNYWNLIQEEQNDLMTTVLAETISTKQRVFSASQINVNQKVEVKPYQANKIVGQTLYFEAEVGKTVIVDKKVTNLIDKTAGSHTNLWDEGKALLAEQPSFDEASIIQNTYWQQIWNDFDIEIIGDDKNQQGIRFCIFQLQQTYNGVDPSNNIGAKGLTGEAYSGHAFWDTETYCLPFFLFNNPQAAKNLLMYRYNTLDQAKERALQLDCKGACYPIATLNGDEACTLWQHASLQFQPSTAVAYGIWHYVKITGDTDFLYHYGLEMLVEVSRLMISRGQWNAKKSKFGYYGVMGPDEFQMMVNHNCYTNFMAKKTLEYTLQALNDYQEMDKNHYDQLIEKLSLLDDEIKEFRTCAEAMYLPFDEETKIYEQHEGFFDLPHIDVDKIPVEDFPLYAHWSYDRIYRNDMIKQPDVLMFMFLFNQEFSLDVKRANYDYYEPRTIHESSLSPSIHSVFAAELDKIEEAVDFFGFATRMDIDDYNRNTNEGLHTTSIAAAWINIVYGFGGFRSDGEQLILNPIIPEMWKQYSFRFKYHGNLIVVKVNNDLVELESKGQPVELVVYGEKVIIGNEKQSFPVKNRVE
jgi:maltose phosphorylase